LILYLIINSCF